MTKTLEVRTGSYVDSVSLMQVSKRVSSVPGVSSALVAMATDLNLELAAGMGFDLPEGLVPNEMLVGIDADGPEVLQAALAELEAALAASRTSTGGGRRTRGGAGDGPGGRRRPDPDLAAADPGGPDRPQHHGGVPGDAAPRPGRVRHPRAGRVPGGGLSGR